MRTQHPPAEIRTPAEIAADPKASDWLKSALASALGRDNSDIAHSFQVFHDAEVLYEILSYRYGYRTGMTAANGGCGSRNPSRERSLVGRFGVIYADGYRQGHADTRATQAAEVRAWQADTKAGRKPQMQEA